MFEIKYEEDEVRDMFYKGHVSELVRPVCVSEDVVLEGQGEGNRWETEVSGESYVFCR